MSDNPTTGVSTGTDPAVSHPGTTGSNPVNPAQSFPPPSQPSQQQSQNSQDVSGLIASYEARISKLMSEKDKALNERNQAITQLTELQNTYTQEKSQTSESLNNTAQAAQTAINAARLHEQTIADLQGQLLRANLLLEKPHLAPYAQLIPANNDAEKMKALVDQLEVTRNADLERSRQAVNPYGVQPQPGSAPMLPGAGLPNQTLPTQVQQQVNPLASLYGNRPGMNPQVTMPGSSPALMNPAGAGSVTGEIDRMLTEALSSGDANKYAQVLEQVKAIANANISQQLGR